MDNRSVRILLKLSENFSNIVDMNTGGIG